LQESTPATWVPVESVKEKLRRDPTVPTASKKYLDECPGRPGFLASLEKAGSVNYCKIDVHSAVYDRSLITRGLWKYDATAQRLWLWEWGDIPKGQQCGSCSKVSSLLTVCDACKFSVDAIYYCADNPQCKELCDKEHTRRHDLFQKYGPRI